MELLPRAPSALGRKQTVTASAWIERTDRRSNFLSKVSLGKGRIYELSTKTQNRAKALDFNRCHLLSLLNKPVGKPTTATPEVQLQFLSPTTPSIPSKRKLEPQMNADGRRWKKG